MCKYGKQVSKFGLRKESKAQFRTSCRQFENNRGSVDNHRILNGESKARAVADGLVVIKGTMAAMMEQKQSAGSAAVVASQR